jgi:hypothetical protein
MGSGFSWLVPVSVSVPDSQPTAGQVASARFSPIAIPESATADDVWLCRKGRCEWTRAKIVTSGTYCGALFCRRASCGITRGQHPR